jgi:hypothetical protein
LVGRQESECGFGTALTTQTPKSDKVLTALGAAMKLAKSATFSPEKILSLAIASLLNRCPRPFIKTNFMR